MITLLFPTRSSSAYDQGETEEVILEVILIILLFFICYNFFNNMTTSLLQRLNFESFINLQVLIAFALRIKI